MNAEQFKQFKALRAAGATIDKAARTAHVARGEATEANRCETYEDYAKIAGKKPKKPKTAQPPEKKGYPGGLCKHKDTCKFWKSANGNRGNQGGLKFCHYPLELGTLRPWPASECPGFTEPIKQKKKSFDFD